MTNAEAVEYAAAEYGTDPTTIPPVAVEVVAPVRVEDYPARTIVADQIAVGAVVAVRVAGELRTRASLTLRARGGSAFLGASPGVTPGTGYQLAAGESITIAATDAVYAISDTSAVVHVLAELREG